MGRTLSIFIVCWCAAVTASGGERSANYFAWDRWEALAVQDGGRCKPFDTLAWETFRGLSNRLHWSDPATQQVLESNTLYLAMLFEWQGWDRMARLHSSEGTMPSAGYLQLHRPDKWDELPMLRIYYLPLREALGISRNQRYISPLALTQATIQPPGAAEQRPFMNWAEGLINRQQEGLTRFEEKALELAGKLRAYQEHRMGKRLALIPIQGDEHNAWLTLYDLWRMPWDDRQDPTGELRRVRDCFANARAAYGRSAANEFNEATRELTSALAKLGPRLGSYPSAARMRWEVFYNQVAPFRWAWILTIIAAVALAASMVTAWRWLHRAALLAMGGGMLAMLAGFALRIALSGRAPVTNMYESVVYVGFGVALFGVLFAWRYRQPAILAASAVVSSVALILADNCPAVLDASLQPLQPVLRSNFWLVTHVMTITLSYAALGLAMGLGNLTLAYFLLAPGRRLTIQSLTRFTYRALQVGVLLLAAGTILGGVWADYSWGRFWGWDPKEVWALVALLGYLAVLHARYVGWVRPFGLAALSVLCFGLVIVAWYGVNFVLGAGLHSYGFGGGGAGYVFAALTLQAAYVAVTAFCHARRDPQGDTGDEGEAAGHTLPRAAGYGVPSPHLARAPTRVS